MLDDAGRLVAVIERKAPGELASKAVGGTMAFALAELSTVPRAILVVEGRLSDVLKAPGDKVSRGWLLNTLAALQATYPQVAWVYADNRALAEDYGYRWLAAAATAAKGSDVWARSSTDGSDGSDGSDSPRIRDDGRSSDRPPARSTAQPAAIQRPLLVSDRAARLGEAMALARAGHPWASGAYAKHFGVSQPTATADLKALVEAGALVAEGAGRGRRYVAGRGGGVAVD